MSKLTDTTLTIRAKASLDSTMDSATPTPKTFTRFPLLPPELRLAIWTLARPSPRFLKLYCRTCGTPHHDCIPLLCGARPSSPGQGLHNIYSSATVPSLLHACPESRTFALEWYKLSFGSEAYTPKVYFDWERDGLWDHCDGSHPGGGGCNHVGNIVDFLQDGDIEGMRRLLLEGPCGLRAEPWRLSFYWLNNLRDLYLLESGTGANSPFFVEEEDLVVKRESFPWQVGNLTLMEMYDRWRAAVPCKWINPEVPPVLRYREIERVTVGHVEELLDDG